MEALSGLSRLLADFHELRQGFIPPIPAGKTEIIYVQLFSGAEYHSALQRPTIHLQTFERNYP
jgi:hypothetical protein